MNPDSFLLHLELPSELCAYICELYFEKSRLRWGLNINKPLTDLFRLRLVNQV
jgi:hypothetical protein